jgi:lysyl-tRNA synthetase class II
MAMRCLVIKRGFVWLVLLLAGSAFAHHSVSNFDFDKSVTVSGNVKYFSFTNPHSFIDIEVKDEKGAVSTWKVFATSKVVLQRYGWSPSSVKVGDTITVTGHPDKTKPREMYLTKIKFANGKEWLRSSIDN